MRQISIIDSTLRDGLQRPNLFPTLEQRLAMASHIINCGIDELEAGVPAARGEEAIFITELLAMQKSTPVRQWCRARQYDLDVARGLSCSHIHFSLPVSDHILSTLGWSWPDAMKTLRLLYENYSGSFESITVGFQDIARAPLLRLQQAATLCDALAVPRVRLADTLGILLPDDVSRLLNTFQQHYNMSVDFHAHNDLGLATANSLAAIYCGADTVSVTVNGIGERAGNTCLAEIAVLVDRSPKLMCRTDVRQMYDLSNSINRSLGLTLSEDKPLVGKFVFSHASSIHISSMRKNSKSYMGLQPGQVGRSSHVMCDGIYSSGQKRAHTAVK